MAPALQVAHHVPGRLRLRLSGGGAPPENLAEMVGRLPYVRSVEHRVPTGSVVVEYAPAAYGEFSALLRRYVPGAESATARPPQGAYSQVAQRLIDGASRLDDEIRRASAQQVDLRLLFPLAVAAYGLVLGGRMPPPSIGLGLFATSLFVALHRSPVPPKAE